MNIDDLKSSTWLNSKVDILKFWSKLSEHDVDKCNHEREKLIAILQIKYNMTKLEAENKLKNWEIENRSFL